MQKIIWTAALCTLWMMPVRAINSDTARAVATLPAATVYFGYGAEITHQAKIQVGMGTRFIVIDRLSTSVDINTLQISCPEDVSILSHRFSVFYPKTLPPVKTKELQRLEDSLQVLEKEAGRIRNQIAIEQETMAKTGSLIESALSGGNKTVSGAEVLKLVEYYNGKIEKSKTAIYQHNISLQQQEQRMQELKNRIREMAGAQERQKPYGQLILQVMSRRVGEIPVSLSYYTSRAGWTPVFDIRVNSKTNKIKLVYKASLTQTTGIDWKNTKLTLSTGTPNFGVSAPVLTPWYLQLYVPEIYNALQGRVAGINAMRNTIQSMPAAKEKQEIRIRGLADEYIQTETDADTTGLSTLQEFMTLSEGQLNTNFEIDLPYDITSDGQLHSVAIKDEEIAAVLKNYAVPRADKEAYLLAEVANWQNLDLLPGDANIIMDDTYIGKSVIDPNTTMDTLNLSLGKDKRVVVKRSVVKELSSLKSSGGSNRQSFTYELIVKNNKLTDVNMLLKDQYPLSTIKEVEVKLEDGGVAMVNEETGVLTWKLSLKPGESKKFRFTYSVKYPKDKRIVNLK
ncbi:MAG TPA: DUF4139 domain-containing protein [Chitinophagaceae bacterium]|nr:DUF4139 domain-containing protein [Chitinophagaceae bacterium]